MLSVYPTFVLGLSVCLSVCLSFIVLLLKEGKGREAGIHCHHPEAELSAVFTVAAVQVQEKELDAGARALPIYRNRFPADDSLQKRA